MSEPLTTVTVRRDQLAILKTIQLRWAVTQGHRVTMPDVIGWLIDIYRQQAQASNGGQ